MKNTRLKKIVAGFLVVGMILGFTPVTKTDVFAEHETESFYPSEYTTSEEKSFEDFIERLYTIALNRDSDAEGKAFWIKRVTKEGSTGADCARFFLLDAPEFMNRNLSVDTFVETLYKTFFDRKSDAAGKKGWVDAINSKKMTRADVVNNFIESTEWCNVCADYGVKSGAKYHKSTIASKNATDFATRLYTCCLKRDPEDAGLKYWSLALTNLEQTGCTAAQNFFESKEFIGFKTNDKEYLTRLYTTFMGRDPDDDGMNYWLGELKKSDRTTIMARFAECQEFTDICLKYGIDKGSIVVPVKATPTPTPRKGLDRSVIPGTDESYAVIRQAIQDAMVDKCSWKDGEYFNDAVMKNQQKRAEYSVKHGILGHMDMPGTFVPYEAASGLTCYLYYNDNHQLIKTGWTWYDHSGTPHQYFDDPYSCFYDLTVFDIVEHSHKISDDPEKIYLGFGVYGQKNKDYDWWDFNEYTAADDELGRIIRGYPK